METATKALVTGATGLVGSHLVRRLLEQGHGVRALVRDPRRIGHPKTGGLELVRGNLHDPGSLERAAHEIDVVYHCAARVVLPYQGDRPEILKTNVEGTGNLLEACARAGVRRFVFVSSVAVYGDTDCEVVSEDHPLVPNGPYSESKVLAEKLIREYQGHRGLETAILRPCVIYGPGDDNFLPQFFEFLPRQRFPLVNGGRQPLDMVYVTDVVEALILAGTREEAVGQAYNVTDGERHTIRELVAVFGEITHRPLRTLDVPYSLAYGFATLSYAWSKLRRSSEEPLISPAGVRALVHPHHYDISKIHRQLGYEPKVKLDEGLRRAVEWYRRLKAEQNGGYDHA